MSQKNEIILNLTALIITGCIMAWIISILRGYDTQIVPTQTTSPTSSVTSTPIPTPIAQARISFGDSILIEQEENNTKNTQFQEAKKSGVQAMATRNYARAITEFERAIKNYRNAPETLIYLNNAKICDEKAYTIAVVAPIGTTYQNLALQVLRGVAQAQDEINKAGGINGVPIKIAIVNDDDDKEIAKKIATDLAKNPEILGVIGHFSSSTTLAAREIYESEKLVAISSTSTSVELSQSKNQSRYVFRTVPSDAFAANELAKYMLNILNKKKAAVFYDSGSSYSNSLKNAFEVEISQNGGNLVDYFDFSSPNFNADANVKQAIDRGAEVLMLAAPDDKLKLVLNIINSNNKQLKLLGGDALYNKDILQYGQDKAVDMVIAIAWLLDANLNSKYVKESRQLWGADVDWNAAITYDASQAFIEALKRNPNPTRSAIQQTLSSPNFSASGVSQTIQFLPSGDRSGGVQLVQIKSVTNSRSQTGYDFVPVEKMNSVVNRP
ncbi:MAG: ABC transporter substrate-binding protein [Gloeotrichia echinulata DVL01]|jgi:branched-chain amino acid transport system substrate-binding protein|nr:ABC transporter substrate-binding protein [Gloeotrichia echinulata DEX184]MCM0594502.1 ABC transporter substrate-binding protein [Gloeotrichia echinulata DEX184]